MNRLVIIGNGFDMAHGLKTSYMDFINWYWDKRVKGFECNSTRVSEDCLCKLIIKGDSEVSNWKTFALESPFFKNIRKNEERSGYDVVREIQNFPDIFSVDFTEFFQAILKSVETKGWVDIENDYYQQLKNCTENNNYEYSVRELNEQFAFLREKLIEYLRTLSSPEPIETINMAMTDSIRIQDLSIKGKTLGRAKGIVKYDINSFDDNRYMEERFSGFLPERIMLLCFNYTGTAKIYEQYGGLILNYIHGELDCPERIIFANFVSICTIFSS